MLKAWWSHRGTLGKGGTFRWWVGPNRNLGLEDVLQRGIGVLVLLCFSLIPTAM